jgi:hypothetical protein
MVAAGGHRTDSRRHFLEGSSRLHGERFAKNFAVLGFGGSAVFGGAQFEPDDEFLIKVADDELCR